MNLRPSRWILAKASRTAGIGSAQSLRHRLVFFAGVTATVVLGAVAYGGLVVLRKSMSGDEDARIINSASLSKQLVDRVLAERARQVELIATSPSVIVAAKKGAEASKARGLTKLSAEQLDNMFRPIMSQQVDTVAEHYLADLLPKLDIAEVMVTDRYGFNAVVTSPPSDFMQSDEGWWQTAWATGSTTAQAAVDGVTQRTVVELSAAIRERKTKIGVVKVKFALSTVDSVLMQGSAGGSALRVDLVDSTGKIIASSDRAARLKMLPQYRAVIGRIQKGTFDFSDGERARHAATSLANGGRWTVVAHMSARDAMRSYDIARAALIGGVVVMLLLILVSLTVVGRFLDRRITLPAKQLAEAAEAVAAGDLSKSLSDFGSNDEIGRLSRAVASMLSELRRLVGALTESAQETASMTAEINASSEEMAASAGQIAHTAADLSQQAHIMAETIQTLATSSEDLVSVAANLDAGAREGVERNTHLRALALENRARLDESSQSLSLLSSDVQASAAAIDQLAEASQEVRSFVTLVQKLARQSKLLALNAAMEAARAGDHGHGFAVVAEEVRRLAAMSSDAAERTERVVNGVLNAVTQSRTSSERTVETVQSVLTATEQGSRSFGAIEQAVAEADSWTASIQQAVAAATGLSGELREKLDSLATGTESFAAAMQEVAASSQEQSASTQEIAGAAGTLSVAADRLGKLVANLRLENSSPSAPVDGSPPSPTTQVRPGPAGAMVPGLA